MTPLLFALPWLAVLAFTRFVVRFPREVPPPASERDPPLVSVIVPARNERLNIEACLRSLTGSSYPAFEVVVVDDRSEDDTGARARAIPHGNARRLTVLDGAPLPEGWLGKPWACHQGARVAQGALLLFTDADTVHGPTLLERAVAALEEDRADLLTLVGRQVMESFWERLVQPQIFLVMLFRFPRFERTARNARWRDAIANGQFLLFRRSAYEAIGGHEAVQDEVVEDLALAQHVKRAGLALRVRSAEEELATRMYRSLRELVDGWSKNIVLGGLQSVPPPLRRVLAPISLLLGVALWVAPPAALLSGGAASLVGLSWGGPVLAWSAAVYALSATNFAWFTARMGQPWPYGALYPLGAAVGAYIFWRSWRRGGAVEWKGRRYTVPSASQRA